MLFSLLAIHCLFSLAFVVGAPLASDASALAVRQPDSQAAPHFVAYSDAWVSGENGPPSPSVLYGFNTFVIGFLMTSGPADQALEWEDIGASARSSIKSSYANAGIKLLVSAFGSTDAPTSSGYNPASIANTMAQWVQDYDLDGIDVDYEDFNAFEAGNDDAVNWLVTFTQTLRAALPSPQYIVTHAPVAPWFSASLFPSGGYMTINNEVGNLIDWYNIQFYNQGTSEYTTCDGLLYQSSSKWPDSAVFQLNSVGNVLLNKVVIGKPANTGDASNGYMSPSLLAECAQQAQSYGWGGGVMTWQYPDAASTWIQTVRADSWPV